MFFIVLRTLSSETTLEQISKMLKTQSALEEKMFTEFSELNKYQSNQVARTVAYSTNQVMMLHQDVMNISNKLMAVNFGIGKINHNTSATGNTTVSVYSITVVTLISYRYLIKYIPRY